MTMGVRGICYNSESKCILLVKHTYSLGWTLPGGGIEVGESALSALNRELSEEAGLECISARVLDVYRNNLMSKRDHVVIYFVEDWVQERVHERRQLEIAETAWFPMDGLPTELTPCTEAALRAWSTAR